MAGRVTVTDPYTGVKIEVSEGSRLAKLWGEAEKPKRTPRAKSDSDSSQDK